MPGKKRSSKSAVVRSPRKASSRSRSPSGKKKRSKSARSATSKSRASSAGTYREPDILDPPAMANLYYIAHTAVDALEIRGFGWADAPKGKKGKKGKKKK